MHYISLLLVGAICLTATAQPPDAPLKDKRLTVHTLVREDVFAGLLEDDLERFARGEQRIEILLKQRPAEKSPLLAWKAAAVLYRAVRAHEEGRAKEFDEKYAEGIKLISQAKKLAPADPGTTAVIAGLYAVLADRLPEKLRGNAWSSAYEAYQALWKQQARGIEKLPMHLRGELLGGLAESAQRTGRTKEVSEYLDKLLAVAPDSSYGRMARRWKEDPKAATEARLTCLSCHSAGRLSARQAELKGK